MSDAANDRAGEPLRHRKDRDRALILPLVGLILLMPPVVVIFLLDAKLAGIPVPVLYLFTVWALLIAGAAVVSRRLRDGAQSTGMHGTEGQASHESKDTA